MRPRPPARWIWGLAFLLVLGPALLWWALTPSLVVYPVTWLMPDRASAAVRLSNLERAWQRHWQRRGQTAPEAAVRELMAALDKWPEWVKRYGENEANLRLRLYQAALFNAVGEEAWLVFGEYGGAQTGAGQVGFVALIRSRTSVAARVGDLMNLAMSDYRLSTHKYRGVTIYEYQDRKVSRSVTFCQLGGWICASLQQRGLGPLPVIIDRIADRNGPMPELAADWWRPAQPVRAPAVCMAAWPERFWGQLRLFRQQRDEGFSDKSEERITFWQQRLDGIDRLELVQTGESIFDLKLDMIGPRPTELTRLLQFRPDKNTTATASQAGPARPQLGQLDISLGLARLTPPLAGLPADSMLKGVDNLEPLLGPLGDELRNRVQDLPPDVEGRMGLALYPGALLPEATVWLDDAPERELKDAPGQYWPRLASAAPDLTFSIPAIPATQPAAAADDPPADAGWLEFERRIWTMPPPRPILFATVQFERVTGEIQKSPARLFGKKTQKRLRRAERVMKAISLAAPGAAARLDAYPDRWVLRLETP